MSQYTDWFVLVRAAITAVWPECVDDGKIIYHAVQFSSTVLDRKVEAEELPIAVFDCDLGPAVMGITNRSERGPVTIYRIQNDEYDIDQLVSECEDLRDYLWQNPTAFGQMFGNPRIMFSMSLPLNEFFRQTQRALIGAAVQVDVLVAKPMS